MKIQFDFGQNWLDFSQKVLNPEKVQQAKQDFSDLLNNINIKGKSFLDIGFGQGLSLFSAAEKGTKSFGNDINPKCTEVLRNNISYYPKLNISDITVVTGSILNSSVIDQLVKKSPNGLRYDIVHSWGVLHHTGNMKKAIQNAASLVKPGGYFIIAIYNCHWTSPLWKVIKRFYCNSSESIKKLMIYTFYPIIWIFKYLVTGQNPKMQSRGMDFYYNVIDWIGGYPYEYADTRSIQTFLTKLGFSSLKTIRSSVPTGCNEYIFKKKITNH